MPALILASACILIFSPARTIVELEQLPPVLPIGLVLTGSVLAWRFGRSDLVLGLTVVLLAYLVLSEAIFPASAAFYWQILYAGTAILVPLNLLVYAYLEERGFFSYWGILRLVLLGAQAGLIYWITASGTAPLQIAVDAMLHGRLLPAAFDVWTSLPQPAILLSILVSAIFLARVVFFGSLAGMAYLVALVSTVLAFHFVDDPLAVDVFMTAAIVTLISTILQSAYQMAFVDELTGIPGRRALLLDMKKLRSDYVVAMADIDHFKMFNDTYGHDTGDQVLRMVAGRLSKISGGGKVYRYGGEEFTVLMPGFTNKKAKKYLEEIRQGVEGSVFYLRGKDRPKSKPKGTAAKAKRKSVTVTVSIGCAESSGRRVKPDQVMKAADRALYKAKEAGRNRVSL